MKIKRPGILDLPSYRYGILVAAELASEYDGSSTHPYRLRDCILAKLNLLDNSMVKENKNGAKLEAAIKRIEIKVASLEGTMRFMNHSANKPITINCPPVCRKCFLPHRGMCILKGGKRV